MLIIWQLFVEFHGADFLECGFPRPFVTKLALVDHLKKNTHNVFGSQRYNPTVARIIWIGSFDPKLFTRIRSSPMNLGILAVEEWRKVDLGPYGLVYGPNEGPKNVRVEVFQGSFTPI